MDYISKPYLTRLVDARNAQLYHFIDAPIVRRMISENWSEITLYENINNSHQEKQEMPTLPVQSIVEAGRQINTFLKNLISTNKITEIKILEIMCGNCASSKILLKMNSELVINQWICTDVIEFTKKQLPSQFNFIKLNGVDAVSAHGETSNILLLICPPPEKYSASIDKITTTGFCDYYSICDYITLKKTSTESNYIIFIGEMGASDGTFGLYKFMMENNNLTLVHRNMLICGSNQFGVIEKEIFIFEIM